MCVNHSSHVGGNSAHNSLKTDAVLRENRVHGRVVEPHLDDLSQHIAVIAGDGQVTRPDQLFGLQPRPVPVDFAPIHMPAHLSVELIASALGQRTWVD